MPQSKDKKSYIYMRCIILSFLITTICFWSEAKGVFSYNIDEVPDGYNFILYQPDSIVKAKPLIISLHSRSASGFDLSRVEK